MVSSWGQLRGRTGLSGLLRPQDEGDAPSGPAEAPRRSLTEPMRTAWRAAAVSDEWVVAALEKRPRGQEKGPGSDSVFSPSGSLQVKLLQSLGLKSTLITDGSTPINLFSTALGLLGLGSEAQPSAKKAAGAPGPEEHLLLHSSQVLGSKHTVP